MPAHHGVSTTPINPPTATTPQSAPQVLSNTFEPEIWALDYHFRLSGTAGQIGDEDGSTAVEGSALADGGEELLLL